MNPSKQYRFIVQALSFSALVLLMLAAGFIALEQLRSLRDGASHLQTRIAPLISGLNDLDASFSALRTSDTRIRGQLDCQPQVVYPESSSADLYIARLNDDLQQLAELDLGIKERIEFFSLRNAISRFVLRHSEYRALVAAGSVDKAASYFDNLLLATGNDIAERVSALANHQRKQEALYVAQVDKRFSATFWTIVTSLGLATFTAVLIAGWQLRGAWLRLRRAALYAALSESNGQSDPAVQSLVEASRQLHSLATVASGVEPAAAGQRVE